MDSWERFSETSLPGKDNFYSTLNDEHITDKGYDYAQGVWEAFGCKTMGDQYNKIIRENGRGATGRCLQKLP